MQKTRLISQRSSADPAVTLFKLEDPGSCSESPVGDTGSDPVPVPIPSPQAFPARRPKRVKVEELADGNGDDAELSDLTPEPLPTGKGKGKSKRVAERPPKRTPSSRSASASRKQKAIKQALEKPHPAPARWRETYDAIKEMRARFPAPVDTMGCDTAKWKETDPRVRAHF